MHHFLCLFNFGYTHPWKFQSPLPGFRADSTTQLNLNPYSDFHLCGFKTRSLCSLLAMCPPPYQLRYHILSHRRLPRLKRLDLDKKITTHRCIMHVSILNDKFNPNQSQLSSNPLSTYSAQHYACSNVCTNCTNFILLAMRSHPARRVV